MENKEEQFNEPRVVVNLEEHVRRKQERVDKEEIEILRNEVGAIKKEVQKKKLKREQASRGFLSGTEIIEVDPDELTPTDLLVYKKLKDYKKSKLEFEGLFSSMSMHKLEVFDYIVEKKKKEGYDPTGDFPLSDAAQDSRWAFMTWMMNKSLAEYGRRQVLEKKKAKGGSFK